MIYFKARHEAKALMEEVAREESSLKSIGALLAKIEQEVDSLYDSVPETSSRGIHSTEIRNTFYRVEVGALKRFIPGSRRIAFFFFFRTISQHSRNSAVI